MYSVLRLWRRCIQLTSRMCPCTIRLHSIYFFFIIFVHRAHARSECGPYAKKRVCNLSIDIQSSDSRLHIRQFQMQEARKKIKCKIVVQELIGPRVKVNGQPKNSMQLKAWWIIHKRDADSFIRSFAHVFLILCCLFLFCLVTSIIDHSIKCDVDKLFSKWAILSNSWAYICLCVRVAAECQLLFGRKNTAATLYIFFIVRGYANWCWLLIKCSSIHFMFPCVDAWIQKHTSSATIWFRTPCRLTAAQTFSTGTGNVYGVLRVKLMCELRAMIIQKNTFEWWPPSRHMNYSLSAASQCFVSDKMHFFCYHKRVHQIRFIYLNS